MDSSLIRRRARASVVRIAVAAVAATALVAGCGTSPSPAPSPTASPRILAVVAGDGEGGAGVPVTVADLSGHLSDARRATPAEITAEIDRRPMEGAAGGLSPVAGSDRAILAIWAGAECDRSARLTISTGGASLTIAPDRPAACAAASSTYRAVVLTFDRPVDPASIELQFP